MPTNYQTKQNKSEQFKEEKKIGNNKTPKKFPKKKKINLSHLT